MCFVMFWANFVKNSLSDEKHDNFDFSRGEESPSHGGRRGTTPGNSGDGDIRIVAPENAIFVEKNKYPENRRRRGPVAPRADCTDMYRSIDGVSINRLTRLRAPFRPLRVLLRVPRWILVGLRPFRPGSGR